MKTVERLPSGFDLRAIETFVTVVRFGSMTAAADRLGTTQSAVSQVIAHLEQSLGVLLLDRTVRPPAVTTSGRALYERAQRLLAEATAALHSVQDPEQGGIGTLRIAMMDSFDATVGPQLIRALKDRARRWRVWSGLSPDHTQALLDRQVDVIVACDEDLSTCKELETYLLWREPFLVAAPVSYLGDLQDLSKLSASLSFVRYSLRSTVGRLVERQLGRLRLLAPTVMEFDTATAQLAMIQAGLGWGFTTPLCLLQTRMSSKDLRLGPIASAEQSWREIWLVARSGELGGLPQAIATEARLIFCRHFLPQLQREHPWLSEWIASVQQQAPRVA